MSSVHLDDVEAFNAKFGLETPLRPFVPDEELFMYRANFLREELDELFNAYENNDLVKMLDALIDLEYVLLGTVLLFGFGGVFHLAWDEVHKANMAKERASSAAESKRNHAFDVIKPEGWVPPEERLRALVDAARVLNPETDSTEHYALASNALHRIGLRIVRRNREARLSIDN